MQATEASRRSFALPAMRLPVRVNVSGSRKVVITVAQAGLDVRQHVARAQHDRGAVESEIVAVDFPEVVLYEIMILQQVGCKMQCNS